MARALPHTCWFTAILALFFAGSAAGEVASIDVFFDLDRNMATGCEVSTSEGTVFGVELRGRALFDVVPGVVTSSTTAICVDSETDVFGAESAVLAPPILPYGGVPGNGLGGSTLIEFAMPLTLFSEVATAAVYVEATSALGTDALLSYGSGTPIMSMNVFAVPGLVPAFRVGLALLLVGLGGVRVSGKSPRTENRLVYDSAGMRKVSGLVLCGALFAFPDVAQSLLGEGSQRNWSESSLVATDAVGDGTPALDLRGLYGRADAPAGRLWVRADVAFGPGICTDWGRSEPGVGFVCAQEPPIDQGGFSGAVALTFDDGPNPVTTPSVLTTLRAHGIPATFFVLGKKLVTPAERALALEIHLDPLFRLANHTVDHPFLPGESAESAEYQIEETSQRIRDAIGDPCYFPEYFRFPYGAANCTSMEEVRRQGHSTTGVHIDFGDWCYASGGGYCDPAIVPSIPPQYASDMTGYAVYKFLEEGGGIMLMHDIHPTTASALPAIISGLQGAGATFVDLSDLTYFPQLNAEIAVPEAPACCAP